MRKITKKQIAVREQFKKNVTEYILSKGATKSSLYAFQLNTSIGLLRITPYDNWIATCFDDQHKGYIFSKRYTRQDCNRHSGKWNFHYFELTADEQFLDFKTAIETLLIYQPTTVDTQEAAELQTAYDKRWESNAG